MKKRRSWIVFYLVVMLVLANSGFVALSQPSSIDFNPVLPYWMTGVDFNLISQRIADVNNLPNNFVNVVNTRWHTASPCMPIIDTRDLGDPPPDLYPVASSQIRDMEAKVGISYAPSSVQELAYAGDNGKELANTLSGQGGLATMPLAVEYSVLVYDPKALENAGIEKLDSWNEILKLATSSPVMIWKSTMMAGDLIVNATGATQERLQTVQGWADVAFQAERVIDPIFSQPGIEFGDDQTITDAMANHTISAALISSRYYPQAKAAGFELQAIPSFSGSGFSSLGIAYGLTVPAKSAHPDESWLAAIEIANSPDALKAAFYQGYLPATQEELATLTEALGQENPDLGEYSQVIASAHFVNFSTLLDSDTFSELYASYLTPFIDKWFAPGGSLLFASSDIISFLATRNVPILTEGVPEATAPFGDVTATLFPGELTPVATVFQASS